MVRVFYELKCNFLLIFTDIGALIQILMYVMQSQVYALENQGFSNIFERSSANQNLALKISVLH